MHKAEPERQRVHDRLGNRVVQRAVAALARRAAEKLAAHVVAEAVLDLPERERRWLDRIINGELADSLRVREKRVKGERD